MAKFKELLKEKAKERLDEAVGGVVSTPAINAGSGVANGRSGAVRSGDSRVDTGGEFTYRAGELPGFEGGDEESYASDYEAGKSDWQDQANPKQAFQEGEAGPNTVVLHQDDGGSVTLREHGQGNFDVVVRAGSDERVFELDEEAVSEVTEIFS